jgi:hypothetical protein
MIRKTIVKTLALAFAVSGLGVGMAGPAAAYDCAGTLVGDYELWDTDGHDRKVGWLKRYDLPFICTSDSSESKTSYTRSNLFDQSKHTIRHRIYDESSGAFLRGTTEGPYIGLLITDNLKNRTQGEYHISALTAWGYERRLAIQCVNSYNC